MKHLCLIGAAVAMTACMQSPISGSKHSGVRQLQVGMTQDTVGAIIGSHQAVSESGTRKCVSYLYNETIDPKYVHATFTDAGLIEASDGHKAICDISA